MGAQNMRRTVVLLTPVFSLATFALTPANAANLKDDFLSCLKTEQIPVSIYLVNGIKLQGVVGDWNDEVLVLTGGPVDQVVFVHSISTVVPARNAVGESCIKY